MAKILVADDDRNLRLVLHTELAEAGHDVSEADSGLAALELLGAQEFDVLLLDLSMPRMGGMETLEKLQQQELPAEVIVLTAHGSVSLAVAAMRLGAYDFLTKPFKIAELLAVIEKAVEKRQLRRENALLKTRIQRQEQAPAIVSRSAAMNAILATVEKVAPSDFPLLVQGESGVGKELVARAIHRCSPRAAGPFIALNCGAVPEQLIESELFGHEKGAFTGAVARKLGLLELAQRGTLFLDEIGEMPPALQVKFLRILETGSFYRVGGVKEVTVDFRCVSATNKDLPAEVAAGRFRPDLYYRISTVTLPVPPLRERPEDVPALIEHFVAAAPLGRRVSFSEGALRALSGYSWPGNVRELQNVVYRLLLLAKDDLVRAEDLPPGLGPGGGGARTLAELEREHILKALRESGGRRGKAAAALGIDPKTLYRKLARLPER
jgi:DNA-binding NtrC family response regulator